jgi:hypothetical protein
MGNLDAALGFRKAFKTIRKGEFKNPKSAEGCEIEGWIQIQLYKNHVGS